MLCVPAGEGAGGGEVPAWQPNFGTGSVSRCCFGAECARSADVPRHRPVSWQIACSLLLTSVRFKSGLLGRPGRRTLALGSCPCTDSAIAMMPTATSHALLPSIPPAASVRRSHSSVLCVHYSAQGRAYPLWLHYRSIYSCRVLRFRVSDGVHQHHSCSCRRISEMRVSDVRKRTLKYCVRNGLALTMSQHDALTCQSGGFGN